MSRSRPKRTEPGANKGVSEVVGSAIVGFAFGSTITWNVWTDATFVLKNVLVSLMAGLILGGVLGIYAAFRSGYFRR
jgi:hypothetical protein